MILCPICYTVYQMRRKKSINRTNAVSNRDYSMFSSCGFPAERSLRRDNKGLRQFEITPGMGKHDFFKHTDKPCSQSKKRFDREVPFRSIVEKEVQPGRKVFFGPPVADQDRHLGKRV